MNKERISRTIAVTAGILAVLFAFAGCSDDATSPIMENDVQLEESTFDAYAKVGVEEFSQDRTDRWDRLTDLLDLTPEQLEQLQTAFEDLHVGLADLHDAYHAGDLTREEVHEQIAELVAAFETDLQEILTAEQLELLEGLRQRARDRQRERDGDCDGDQNHEGRCFELVFPVTFIMPDESTIVVEGPEGFADLRSWYDGNPEATDRPQLQYPVEISYGDDVIVTINNEEEMQAAREDCRADGDHDGNAGQGH